MNESLTLARFDHPHIVKSETKMISVLLDDELKNATNEKFLIGMPLEYIGGNDLIWHLRRYGTFSEKKP